MTAIRKQGNDAMLAVAASNGIAAAEGQRQGSNNVMGAFMSMLQQQLEQQQQQLEQQQLKQQQQQQQQLDFQLAMEQQQCERQWREGHPPRRQ